MKSVRRKNALICVLAIIITIVIVITATFLLFFPTTYKSEIRKYSSKYNLSMSMVASIIKVESNYNVNAVSKVGAIGLMQLMPTTAVDVANRMGIEFKEDDLFIPSKNIEMGCYYLRYLLDIFGENIDNALSAYNWGLSNVRNWLLMGNSDGYGTIRDIPVQETKNYLKKYKNYRWVYSNIFGYDV